MPVVPYAGARSSAFLSALLALVSASAAGNAPADAAGSTELGVSLSAEKATSILADLAREVETCAKATKPLLLGDRDASGPSCVMPVKVGQIKGHLPPPLPTDIHGGPGTRMGAVLREGGNAKSLVEHYSWHQVWLRAIIESYLADCKEVLPPLRDLTAKAGELARGLEAWVAWQDGFTTTDVKEMDHWPGYCLKRLNEAVAAKDLRATKRWTKELSAAAFALSDLHRWLRFLLENQLESLDFQARFEFMFRHFDKAYAGKYNPFSDIDQFPAGILTLHGIRNHYEIERQAEFLFRVSKEYQEAARDEEAVTPGSVWLTPHVRRSFLKLRSKLSRENQKTWDTAAASPYERSYLVNMLYRAQQAETIDELETVLERFDKVSPDADVSSLMGVLMYRGHSFAGLEWADRFDPRLMKASGELSGDRKDVLLGAQKIANSLYGDVGHYQNVLTLREALDKQKLDCVRGTDMIGALYRNAGQAGFCHIRWSCGIAAHSVAAADLSIEGDANSSIGIVDALVKNTTRCETWPQAYFNGHDWPAGLPQPEPVFAVDLYVRGLNNYVWAEGYAVRGPNAGTLMKAQVPYLPRRHKAFSGKVFDGPYPEALPKPATSTAPTP